MTEPGTDDEALSHTSGGTRTFHQTALETPRDAPTTAAAPVQKGRLEELRLPNGFNVVAVRELLLSEASFVSPTNKSFWRRMMNNTQFVTLFTAAFHHILDSVSDNGMVFVEKLTDVQSSELVSLMSVNLAEMYYLFNRGERDLFLPKLAELVVFMVVNALQAAAPKHQRVFNSSRFRELILDWLTELVGGIRSVNARAGKEWLFHDATDHNIMTTNTTSVFQQTITDGLAQRNTTLPLNSVGCRYNLDHSPLLSLYIQRTNPSVAAQCAKNVVHVTLSHAPDRPLLSLQSGLVKAVKFRERRVDYAEAKDARKAASASRLAMMGEYKRSKAQVNEDIGKLREGMNAAIAMLKGGRGSAAVSGSAQSAAAKRALIAQLTVTNAAKEKQRDASS